MNDSTTSAPLACDMLVRADTVLTQDDQRTIIDHGAVAITGDRVVAVGTYADLERSYEPKSRLDLSGKMLMPGLVNGHTHLPMTLFRGFADDLPLMQWLEDHIWPVEFQLTDEMLEIGAKIGCAEFIRTGCTSSLNGYFHEWVTGDVISSAGLRAVLGEGFFNFPSPHFPTAEDCWKVQREVKARFENDPLIRTAITPHAVFTVAPENLSASFELAKELDIPWQVHAAESTVDTATCIERFGKRPIQILADEGLLSERTVLHHCVDINDKEIALLADTRTKVVHNPASNQKLCSGFAQVQKMLDAGVNVGLGTDGASSNNQLNLFSDMRLAALAGKVTHGDASAVNAQAVLDMATRGSAACLGWPELGRIEPGYPADMIALDLSHPNMMPMFNPISHVVYATTGMEVCMTMVAGEILFLYDEFRTLDMTALRTEAFRAVEWIREKAKK